ncbi:Vacuolar protein sorting-associated protein 54 chloroplastic [Zea mays]|jgi:hypothetical protein|uniref:Vacuolar protein sorting-associated protein 54 chloroplastic n=1 Tax=Zea mays TaxID=4577 RepID=A0A1D6J4F4_MAIZE|nr:Vacuolar protein sorting-associated protein 54 chloroplastic [Zea mays]
MYLPWLKFLVFLSRILAILYGLSLFPPYSNVGKDPLTLYSLPHLQLVLWSSLLPCTYLCCSHSCHGTNIYNILKNSAGRERSPSRYRYDIKKRPKHGPDRENPRTLASISSGPEGGMQDVTWEWAGHNERIF